MRMARIDPLPAFLERHLRQRFPFALLNLIQRPQPPLNIGGLQAMAVSKRVAFLPLPPFDRVPHGQIRGISGSVQTRGSLGSALIHIGE